MVVLFVLSGKAQDILVYPTDSSFIEVGPHCLVYKCIDDTLTLDQVKNLPESAFHRPKKGSISYPGKVNIWIKLNIENQTSEDLYLHFLGWGLLQLDVYSYNDKGELSIQKSGTDWSTFHNRALKRGTVAVNLGKSPKEVYINLASRLQLITPISISALKPLADVSYRRDTINALLMGILLAMALYNLFLFFSVKEKLYLYYVVYILVILWIISEMNSTYRQFLCFGMSRGLRELLIITGVLFSREFLQTKKNLTWGDNVLKGTIVLMVFYAFFSIVLDKGDLVNSAYQVTSLITLVLLEFLGIRAYLKGNKSALIYSIAWSGLFVTGIVNILSNMGIIPTSYWTLNAIAFGASFETLLLAFALAYRLREYREASEKSQKLAYERLQENEKLVREQNKLLEEKVQERTVALKESIEVLKNTQDQLIQSEKLASLGELTAGIAHEIQNPLNFVNNFSELSIGIVKDLEVELKRPDKDEGYINELFDDLSQNQEKINHHGKRASNIVKGMLEHSRTSTGVKEPIDINRLADEYLKLAYHGLRAKDKSFNADFKTNFDEQLPLANVIPQDFGRVLLNLISNAFYAVRERKQKFSEPNYQPCVTITSLTEDGHIVIKVRDNGTGIPDSVKNKIFQPFFTTKPTGEGTGLGLSLSYDIITKSHGGTLEVETKEGEFTEFLVKLP